MSDSKPLIQVIYGSSREGRLGEPIVDWFYKLAQAREDITTELIDVRDLGLPFFNHPSPPGGGDYAPEATAWATQVGRADGFVVVTPEYNHSLPAVLKNALDHIYFEWNRKPIGFVSYGGGAGGARSVEQLRLVAVELQLAPIRHQVTIPMFFQYLSEEGFDGSQFDASAGEVLDQITWWAQALKVARAQTD